MHGDEIKFVTEAYETNWMSTVGANINELESLVAAKVGCKYAVALSAGTAALHLCTKLAGEALYGMPKVGEGALRGHKVFCSDMTFDATVNPVAYENGEAVFIDTEYDTWNMDPVALEKAFEIYPDVRLVVLVHLYGTPAKVDEIRAIHDAVPQMELEVFVHGALCMAYSGRCLLSGYLTHRDSNQGACTNSCRWAYRLHRAVEDDTGELVEPDLGSDLITPHSYLLEEPKRPGELMACDEDEHGTYIMNSRDLRAVEHVKRLCEIGVDSLKIEGRTKSFYYCARTASVYRRAIDAAVRGEDIVEELKSELESLAHRGYTDGFLTRHGISEYQNYDYGYSISDKSQFVGEVTGVDGDGLWQVSVRNRFELGDTLEILAPGFRDFITLDNLMDRKKQPITVAPGDGHVVYFRCPFPADRAHMGIIVRHFRNGENTRNPVIR